MGMPSADDLFRRIQDKARAGAEAAVKEIIGSIIVHGRVQWPALLGGHGYELTQAAYGYDATHAVITVAPGATTATQHVAFDTARPYVSGSTPVVLASSGDGNWLASWSNVDDSGFDLTVTAIPATVSGEHDVAIASGTNSGTQAISFGVTFTAAPVVEVEVVDDPLGGSLEGDYQPSIQGRSTTGFTARLVHFPVNNGVLTSDSTDYTTGMYPTAGTVPASTTPLPTGDVNLAAGLQPTTGDQSQGHQHPETAFPGNTGDEDRSHHHDEGHHDHNTADHRHNLNNHHHTVNMFPNEGGTRHLTVGWTATGIVTAAGGDVPVSWLAIGLQTPPS